MTQLLTLARVTWQVIIVLISCIATPLNLSHVYASEGDETGISDVQSRIDSLNVASKHFQQNVAFACTFAYNSGSVNDWDIAMAKAGTKIEDKPHRMAKLKMNFALEMGAGADNHSGISMLSANGIQAVINQKRGNCKFISPDSKAPDRFLAFYIDPINFSPFFLGGGKYGEIITPLLESVPEKLTSVDSFSVNQAGRLVVTQRVFALGTKGAINNYLEFEIIDGFPVLRLQTYEELNDNDGSVRLKSRCELENYVKCGDVYMASNMSRVLGPLGESQYAFWSWQSDDLGKRLPIDSDFVITVPAEMAVSSADPLPENRELNPAYLVSLYEKSSEQFQQSLAANAEMLQTPLAEASKPPKRWTQYLGIAVTIILLFSVLASLTLRIYRAKIKDELDEDRT